MTTIDELIIWGLINEYVLVVNGVHQSIQRVEIAAHNNYRITYGYKCNAQICVPMESVCNMLLNNKIRIKTLSRTVNLIKLGDVWEKVVLSKLNKIKK